MVFMFLCLVCNFVCNGYFFIDEVIFECVLQVFVFVLLGRMRICDFCVGEGVVLVEVVYFFGCDQV